MGAPFPIVDGRALAGARLELEVAPPPYASRAPAMWEFRCAITGRVRHFAGIFGRAQVMGEPEFVLRIAGARVFDGKVVFGADGAAAAQSFAGMRPTEAELDVLGRRVREEAPVLVGRAGVPVVHVFKRGAGNYGHLLVDILPKFVHLAALGVRRCDVLLPDEAREHRGIVAFAASACGVEVEWVACPPGSIVEVADLLWVGPVSTHDRRKSPTLLALRERLLARVPVQAGPERLFVTRRPDAKRPIAGLAAVEAMVERRGFTVVEPGSLSFVDQLALFRGAKSVVGPLGAALSNTLAMEPGGQVGMFDPGLIDCFYWDLACLGGQRFTWMFTRDVGHFERAGLFAPWTLEPDLAGRALDWMEAGAAADQPA